MQLSQLWYCKSLGKHFCRLLKLHKNDYTSDFLEDENMENKMKKCPLKMETVHEPYYGTYTTEKECDPDRCAWWDADKERCAVLSIARNK